MWWNLLFPLAAADAVSKTVDFVNTVYRTTVSGGKADIYSLKLAAYDEALELNGVVHQQVLLLENELSHQVEMHSVRCWEDLYELEYQLSNNTAPDFAEDNSTEAQSYVEQAASATLNTTGAISGIQKQVVHLVTLDQNAASELLEFKLYNARVLVGSDIYRLSVFLNHTGEVAASFASKYSPTSASFVSTAGVSLKKLLVSLLLASLLTAVGTYLALYRYWRKKGTLPYVKGAETRHVPFQ
mmetsp:Transcript_28755/g.51161  ORF Transcript_28755/g.51161 Transcript_28755/m.51161 type:complete len:242 (+) Transcript_28755:662-1387(+)|eukprot:CAMPEP_0204916742 /NCGR_PEP_ID=MMETSP1397-20131031/14487_1 /ASSEMBLY_ACC=CAM_ASM_000891 /TAXON_ID=49980 /ORGANISM="Climacostomum Climacostomum virens, Strain Stock W-24" /LENGTH=241 /DNA_ID=CAMNT_0052089363 /DNA_START=47 /DNA_END=772 /DNA_ORIENTATION=-